MSDNCTRKKLKTLDLITIGRASVDLYGDQTGGRLEDMASFSKYIGGSPTNIAAGSARLGLRSALITRVGDEHMGRFIKEQLIREGVDVTAVKTDPDRLTALAILGIRDKQQFPLLFYRENCADMAISEEDIDAQFIASARCVCATGTHLSHPKVESASLKAIRLARESGARTALDIDYRPNLWGLAGHGFGEGRYIESRKVTAKLQSTLGLFDLIVGTEEEFHIAGGTIDTLDALRAVRQISDAVLVCKRGPVGAVAFETDIPDSLDLGIAGEGFKVDVFNVVGAGDGFMSGLLTGWLTDCDWNDSLRIANACGAFSVSRHGCTPSYPSRKELDFFLERGIKNPALRKDRDLEQIHWSTNRSREWSTIRIFAFDHRKQFEELAARSESSLDRIGEFKKLCLRSARKTATRKGFGIICDDRYGEDALHQAAGTGLLIGRATEKPGSRPLELEDTLGPDFGGLREWPLDHVVKVLCRYHPEDDDALKQRQEEVLRRLFRVSRRNRLELLLEIISPQGTNLGADGVTSVIQRIYDIGIFPDWWKLEPFAYSEEWKAVCHTIDLNDKYSRGIVVLGLDAPMEELVCCFRAAASFKLVKGFAVGRTIFRNAAERWFHGKISDSEAVDIMASNYAELCSHWDNCRSGAVPRNMK